jgi:Tol biopolymer transport system component
LWFTATEAGGLRALRAVTLDGRQRLLYRAPERMQLEDVSADGRVLVTGITLHSQVRFGSLSGKVERDLSWFDYPSGPSLSADGKLMSFSESGEGAGASYGVFVRPTNGDPAVRIADGAISALSRDGTRIAIASGPTAKSILIAPTGPGTPRTIDISKYGLLAFDWFPDNRRLTVVATEQGKPARTYVADTDSGSVTPLTEERVRVPWASPDGQWLAGSRRNERVLYDVRARATVPLKGSVQDDVTAGWAPDSRSVLVYQAHDNVLQVFRIDVTSGVRSPVATIESADKSGFVQSGDLAIAADGDHYAYDMIRQLSHLYLLKLPQ